MLLPLPITECLLSDDGYGPAVYMKPVVNGCHMEKLSRFPAFLPFRLGRAAAIEATAAADHTRFDGMGNGRNRNGPEPVGTAGVAGHRIGATPHVRRGWRFLSWAD